LVRTKGRPVSGETGIEFLREKILENRFIPASTPGKVIPVTDTLVKEIDYSFRKIDISKIKPFTIVADAANSMGAIYLEQIFLRLNKCKLIKLNFDLDGTFPAHEADPLKEENLIELKESVLKNKADLGIATDGDGDRIFFVDDKGDVINPAILRGLLSKIFLQEKNGAKIGYDVRPGKITADLITENGGVPIITRVGHSLIKEQMIKEDIYFAGESSGHFYLNTSIGCFEYPTIMILKLLYEFSQINEPISEYLKQYQRYFGSGEINREVKDKNIIFEKIKNTFSDAQINTLDGVSVTYPDFWFNVRGSNTEEKVRLNLEAISNELMLEKTAAVLALIENQ
jgi:phosphomannomutase